MALYGAFDRKKLFGELATADTDENGVLKTPAQLRNAALQNLTDVAAIEASDFAALDGAIAGTGVASKAVVLDANGNTSVPGKPLTTQRGAGFGNAAEYTSAVYGPVGGIVRTSIIIDLTGVVSSTTAADIIGDDGEASAHLGQIITTESGIVYRGSISCLEVPAGGDTDLDLYAADESTGAEDAAITGLVETLLAAAGGAWTLGATVAFAASIAASKYLYMAVGGAGGLPGTYTAGKFLIEMEGSIPTA